MNDKKCMGAFIIDNKTIKSLFIKIIKEAKLKDGSFQFAKGLLLQVYAEIIRDTFVTKQ